MTRVEKLTAVITSDASGLVRGAKQGENALKGLQKTAGLSTKSILQGFNAMKVGAPSPPRESSAGWAPRPRRRSMPRTRSVRRAARRD